MIWYKDNFNDIVISTRVRLARNLDAVPFPGSLKDKTEASAKITDAIRNGNSTLSKDLELIMLDKENAQSKERLAEEHLISPQLLEGSGKSVFISKDKTMSVMLMEEDHIRLQVIMAGNALDEAYDLADKVDNVIEEGVTYAFDENFGYLTACPTNAGTGMRASLMLHLPALALTKKLSNVISSAGGMGIAVRGLYGEGTGAYGNFYQISNQITMGISEKEIIERLKNVTGRIIDMEKQAREFLMKNSTAALSDKFYRSYGTLKFARAISSAEAKALLSDVMLGRSMGIIEETGKLSPLECMIQSAPSFINGDTPLEAHERDKKRAEFIRKNI